MSSPTFNPAQFFRKPTSLIPLELRRSSLPSSFSANSLHVKHGFCRRMPSASGSRKALSTKAVLSEVPNQNQYFKVGAESTGPVPSDQLLDVIESAAKTGAQVS